MEPDVCIPRTVGMVILDGGMPYYAYNETHEWRLYKELSLSSKTGKGARLFYCVHCRKIESADIYGY